MNNQEMNVPSILNDTSFIPENNRTKQIASSQIYIVDDFLSKEELQSVNTKIENTNWTYGQKSDNNSATKFWIMHLQDNIYFKEYLKNKIDKEFSKNFQIEHLYANGQTFGQDGSFHQDNDNTSGEYYTFVLYINSFNIKTIEKAGGEFCIKIPNEKYMLSITPLNNRGILFPSHYYHKGNAYNNSKYGLRVSIAWKLKIKEIHQYY